MGITSERKYKNSSPKLGEVPKGRRGLWYRGYCYMIVDCYFYPHFGGANSIILYNKTLNKHVTAM